MRRAHWPGAECIDDSRSTIGRSLGIFRQHLLTEVFSIPPAARVVHVALTAVAISLAQVAAHPAAGAVLVDAADRAGLGHLRLS